MSWPDYNSWNYAPMYPALSPTPAMFPQYPPTQPNPYFCTYTLGSQLRLTSVQNQPPPGMNPGYFGHELPQCTANQHMQYPYAFPANVHSGQTTEHLHNSQAHGCTVQKDKNSMKSENTDNGGTEILASTANEVSLNKINTVELATNTGFEINPGVTTFTDSHDRTWVCERRGKPTNPTRQITSVSSPDTFQAETKGCVSNNAILSGSRVQPPDSKPSLNTHEKTDASEESPATKISSSIFKETRTLMRKVLTTNDIPTLLVIEHITKITNKVISSIRNTKKRGVPTTHTTEELLNVINKIISFVMTLLNTMQNTSGDVTISDTGERSVDEQFPTSNPNPTLSKVTHAAGAQCRDTLQTAEAHTACHETTQSLFSNHRGKHSNQSKDTPSNSTPIESNRWEGATYRLCPAFVAQCSGNKEMTGNGKRCESRTNTAECEPTDVAENVGTVFSKMTWPPIITDEMNGGKEHLATTMHRTDGRLTYLPHSDYVCSAETLPWEINDTSNELKNTLTFNHSPESKFKNHSSYKEYNAKSKLIPDAYADYNKQNYTPHPVGLHTPKNACKSKTHYHGKSECLDYTDYSEQSYSPHLVHTTKNACSKTHFHTSKCQVSVHTEYQDMDHPATEQYPSPLNSEEQHHCSGARTKHKCTRQTCSSIQHRDYHVPCAHKHAAARLAHDSSFDRLPHVGSAVAPLRRTTHDGRTTQTRPTTATNLDAIVGHRASVEQCSCYAPSNEESMKLITIFPRDKYAASEVSEENEDHEADMNAIRAVFKNVKTTTTNNGTRESDNTENTV